MVTLGKTIKLYGFATLESAEAIKEALEELLGEGTVCDVTVGQHAGSRAYAIVQFTTVEAAETIESLAAEGSLWCENSYLKAWEISMNPRIIEHCIDNTILHFGCQISETKFSALWTRENVSMAFGLELGEFHFHLTYFFVDYKLALSYENIKLIELHHQQGQTTKFLIIQLFGAPRIYINDQSYSREATAVQWVREVDFTPNSCIGQSTALCLELPSSEHLPEFWNDFTNYKEREGKLILEKGSSFSCNSDLVPIVTPPQGFNLPFETVFSINSLVQHGCLPGPVLDATFYDLVDPSTRNVACIKHALEEMFHLKECCYDPVHWLRMQYQKYQMSGTLPMSPPIALDDGLVYIRKVLVTPSKVYFYGPEVNLSNRVLRSYPDDIDNFLRVSFVDEDLEKLHSTDLSSRSKGGHNRLYQRILSTLRNGLPIGEKRFEFLAFSNSQLKENSLWMFASRPGLTAADIREKLGDFTDKRNEAKYAARLGQSFSSSRVALNVDSKEVITIPDIKVERGGIKYNFSDGIGKISAELAQTVASKMGFRDYIPSAFQIRYAGCKGVVAVDPTSFVKLSVRESMSKYSSCSTSLDVLAYSKYQPCYLNRQLIILLSTLGVKDHVFERKQKEVISQLDAILTDPIRAQEALNQMSSGESTNVVKEMLKCYYRPDTELFLLMMLQAFRASELQDLRTKARIFIRNGQAMIGCLDETGILEYGQVFVQYSGCQLSSSCSVLGGSGSGQYNILKGKVVIAKNPCLHPGDMRVLKAVDVPALHHMVDCVVFPAKGKRPHPNECSGSDLDGDVYFVCWDPDLIPPLQFPPMDYSPAPAKVLLHDVRIEDVQEHFVDYMVNDNLGIICNAHVVFADKNPNKAMSKQCIKLAKLASTAVDYSKTGIAANIPRQLRVKSFPDYMEKPDKEITYVSQSVLGKLYREVKGIVPNMTSIQSFTGETASQFYDPDMEVEGFEDYISDAFYCKSKYDYKLGNLMDYFGVATEAEIITGCIGKMAKSFSKKRDLEKIALAVRSLRKEARSWFDESNSGPDNVHIKASAWYYVTYHPSYWGRYNEEMNRDHYLSFPWCVHDKLLDIKRDKMSIVRALHLSSLKA